MFKINKEKKKNFIFFTCFFVNFNIFYIDSFLIISKDIKVRLKKNKIYFKSFLGELFQKGSKNLLIYYYYNILFLSIINKKKKNIYINLYTKIIKNKIKGVLQGYKIILIIKGLGFKFLIDNNKLILKLGFSHNIIINIPNKIKILNKKNKIIFYSIDYIFLTKFIYYLRSFKKSNMYKEKGLLLQGEKIFLKEGKINKK